MDTLVENNKNKQKSEASQSKTKDITSTDDHEGDKKKKFRIDSNNLVMSENYNEQSSINYHIGSYSNGP